jgi:hypothetical protein
VKNPVIFCMPMSLRFYLVKQTALSAGLSGIAV